MHTISLHVNDEPVTANVQARTSVADFLRDDLGLTGTHLGCEQGACGACTVLVDGVSVRSCLVFAAQLDGARVTTVEGLEGPDGALHPLQQAFRDCSGLQCGFCTPGFLMSAAELLDAISQPDERTIRETLSGNICRCTGYQGIVEAVQTAAAACAPPRSWSHPPTPPTTHETVD